MLQVKQIQIGSIKTGEGATVQIANQHFDSILILIRLRNTELKLTIDIFRTTNPHRSVIERVWMISIL